MKAYAAGDKLGGKGSAKAKPVKSPGDKIDNKVQKTKNYLLDKLRKGRNAYHKHKPSGIGIFLIVALALYAWDAYSGFNTSPSAMGVLMIIYAAISIIGAFLLFQTGPSLDSMKLFGVSIMALLIPRAFVYASSWGAISPDWAWVFGVLAAPWFWYIYSKEEYKTPAIEGWGKLIIVFLLLVLLLKLSDYLPASNQIGDTLDPKSGWQTFKDKIINPAEHIGKGVSLIDKLKTTLNQSLNMEYFTGQVEQNKDEPLGVYLEDLTPTEPIFYEKWPVVVWATLSGKSFEDIIRVDIGCHAKKDDLPIMAGEVNPKKVELFFNEETGLQCTFDSLPKGNYKVVFTTSFDFSTHGYITYTFVELETKRRYYEQRISIHDDLSIPRNAQAIYTNGPAAIGLMSHALPITVNPDGSLPPFGLTFAEVWQNGDIKRINTLEVQVPEEIQLENCVPEATLKADSDKGTDVPKNYDVYEFKTVIGNEVKMFTTITCDMKISDVPSFMNSNLKVVKTFAVKANYKYIMDKSVSIRVEDV
ncbi:MAG: hypothetical protein ABIB43_04455 [archaeon]